MNRNRLIVGVLVAAVVAFLASTFVYRQFQQVATARPVSTQQVVVASEALPVGTRLTTANVKLIAWPSSSPMAGQLTNVADVVDRAVITNVSPNEPILEAKLAPRSAGAGLPATIPEGMRAVSVAVNDVVGVAGFVTPGTSVDVLVTGQIPGANQNSSTENITRTILENVRVLAAGQKIEQDRDGKPQTVPVVTLLVMPQDAARLTMASTEGKIQLAHAKHYRRGDRESRPGSSGRALRRGRTTAAAQGRDCRTPRAAKGCRRAFSVHGGGHYR